MHNFDKSLYIYKGNSQKCRLFSFYKNESRISLRVDVHRPTRPFWLLECESLTQWAINAWRLLPDFPEWQQLVAVAFAAAVVVVATSNPIQGEQWRMQMQMQPLPFVCRRRRDEEAVLQLPLCRWCCPCCSCCCCCLVLMVKVMNLFQ